MRKRLKKMMVYLVEDSPAIRERLREMVMELDPGVSVLEAASPDVAIKGIVEKRPELVVLDLKLEGGSGLDVLREVNEKLLDTRVIVFSNQASPPYRKKCMVLGAAGFFDKARDYERVRDKVRQVIYSVKTGTESGGNV